ncbi:MAG: FixH family protein [Mycoplasmatales bacterium]
MKKTFFKNTFNIILTLVIIVSIYSISQQSKYKIVTTYASEYNVGSTVKLEIETKKGQQVVQPETLNLVIYNKYNKNETVEAQLQPYEPGKYMIILTPQFTGDYIVNINMIIDSETTAIEEIFNIK